MVAVDAAADDRAVVGVAHRLQRLAQEDAALDRVDLVIEAGDEFPPLDRLPRVALAHFHPDFFRALHHVGVPEVVDRAAGGAEADVGGGGFRLGNKSRDAVARVAVDGVGVALDAAPQAIERAVVGEVFGSGEAGVVVAPEQLVAVPVEAHVERALGVHIAHRGRVVAVDWVVAVRVELAEHAAGVAAGQVVAEIVEVVLGGVHLRGEQVLALDLGLGVEREAAVEPHRFIEDIGPGERLEGAAEAVLAHGEAGEADDEAVVLVDLGAEDFAPATAFLRAFDATFNDDFGGAFGDEQLADKAAVDIGLHVRAGDAEHFPRRESGAVDAQLAAVEIDLAAFQNRSADHVFRRDWRRRAGVLAGGDHIDELRHGAVRVAGSVEDAQHIGKLFAGGEGEVRAEQREGFRPAKRRCLHAGDGTREIDIGGAVQVEAVALGDAFVVAVGGEAGWRGHSPVRVHRDRREGEHGELRFAAERILGHPYAAGACDKSRRRHLRGFEQDGPAADDLGDGAVADLDFNAAVDGLAEFGVVGGEQLAGGAGFDDKLAVGKPERVRDRRADIGRALPGLLERGLGGGVTSSRGDIGNTAQPHRFDIAIHERFEVAVERGELVAAQCHAGGGEAHGFNEIGEDVVADFGFGFAGQVFRVFGFERLECFGDFLIEHDLDFHPAVERPARLGEIARHRLAEGVAFDFHGFRIERELRAEEFGDFHRPGLGQALVVDEDRGDALAQRHVVGMADEAHPQIVAVGVVIEQLPQLVDVFLGNVGDAGLEAHRLQAVGVVARQRPLDHGPRGALPIQFAGMAGVELYGEVDPRHQRLGDSQHPGILADHPGAVRQGCRIELEDEIRPPAGIGDFNGGDVVAAIGVGFNEQAFDRGEPDTGNAGLVFAADAVAVAVEEDLAEDGGLLEQRIAGDVHRRLGDIANDPAAGERCRGVGVAALAGPGARPGHIADHHAAVGVDVEWAEGHRVVAAGPDRNRGIGGE